MGHNILLGVLKIMSKTAERGQWVTLPVDKGYRFQKFSKEECMEKNLAVNRERFEDHLTDIALDGGFIEHQNRFDDMKLGVCPFSYCGCEVIALYNALNALDPSGTHLHALPELIRSMEEKGVMHAGQFGTAPQALAAFLKEKGYHVFLTSNKSQYDRIASHSKVMILTFYNKKRSLRDMIHTICITVRHDGKAVSFRPHNAGVMENFPDLQSLVSRIGVPGKAEPICLIGIH